MQQEKSKKTLIFYMIFCDFACSDFYKFANIDSEMKKILSFILISAVCIFNADASSRTKNTTSRDKNTTARTTRSTTTARNAVKTTVTPRTTAPISVLTPRTATKNGTTRTSVVRSTAKKIVTARNATENPETRTGADYEQCKEAFFTCMDQFCELKNDSFRRCSCNDRIFDFQDISETYQKANDRLVEFSENLDVVGMTYEQAQAMKTASEDEDALTSDKSVSKRLLQAIMNSIKGGDTTVGGKYKDLNSITISADLSNAFGMDDSGQIIAAYNGTDLYKAVYPKCRDAVKEDCNNASLQRAVNAYLMAIEQDCNSVESALATQQKSLKASTHQSSAMLDLARIENRRNLNSYDIATCIANVESAIKSEEVCGENYHKCLDNGQFIDVTTGAPLTGVADFYKLGEMLTFKDNTDIKDQKLSSIQNNRPFVQFFENKTKKFAKDALNKCTEDADYVWQQYLDMALLDIHYAQQSKVQEIKQSCLTLVAQCYDNQGTSVANAMANLTGDSSILLKSATISLTAKMCEDYIASCNYMFNNQGNIIQEYVENTKDANDTLAACRAVAQQCFDKFGGTGYANFYSLQNGLFAKGEALDWFSLYQKNNDKNEIVSPCAKQVAETTGCEGKDILEEVFGGFDKYIIANSGEIVYSSNDQTDTSRKIRSTGVATEVYYKILDSLTERCNGVGGHFVEYKDAVSYGYKPTELCKIDSDNEDSVFYINPYSNPKSSLVYWYHFYPEENMCPSNYAAETDTQSWGICSCWENGGYRSKNGTIPTCRPIIPATEASLTTEDSICSAEVLCPADDTSSQSAICKQPRSSNSTYWCQQSVVSSDGKLCPTTDLIEEQFCIDSNGTKTNRGDSDCPIDAQELTEHSCASNHERIKVVDDKVPTRAR